MPVCEPGTSFAQFSSSLSEFDGRYVNGQKQPGNSGIDAIRYQVRLARLFELSGLPAVAYVQTGIGNIDLDDALSSLKGDAGLEDTALLLAVWPYANHATETYLGLGAYLFVPTGSYDNELGLLSVGANRLSTAFQAAFQSNITNCLSIMGAIDAVWFGTNDDFTSANLELDQKAMYTGQVNLTYQLTSTYSLAASYFYTWGGETILDRVEQDNANQLHRYQISAIARLPVGRFILQYGSDLKRENGFFEDQRAILRFGRSF